MNSKNKDLIQGYSKGLDLSPQGLRFYEQKGIVHPTRDPLSGYRYYSFPDTVAVTTCRKMCCFGYTLDEASDSLKNQTFQEQAETLKEHKKAFQKELERQQLILRRMGEIEEEIQDALNHLEEPQQSKYQALSFLPTRISQETIRDKSLLKQINAWNKCQPFPEIVLLNSGGETVTGIAMTREYMKLLELPWQEEFPAGKGISISMILSVEEIERGAYRTKAEEILKKDLDDEKLMCILFTASLENQKMKVLCRVLLPE